MESSLKLPKLAMNMANPTGQEATRQAADRSLGITLSVFFLGTSAFVAIGRYLGWPGQASAEVICVALGLAATIVWMNRNLPLQNVLLAIAILASLGFVAILVVEAGKTENNLSLGLPLAQATVLAKYMQAAAWALLLLNAQGVARPLAARFDRSSAYGLWMLGFASAFVCGFEVGSAAALSGPSNKTWAPKAATLVGWYCFALLCLALASPPLLKPKPGPRVVSMEPAGVWIGLNLVVMATAATRGFWNVAVFQAVLIALGAWAGLRAFCTR